MKRKKNPNVKTKLTFQKGRTLPKVFHSFYYLDRHSQGSYSYIFSNDVKCLEMKVYSRFLRVARKLAKRKRHRVACFFVCNHILSKKSKNSRMGRSKGKFLRMAFVSRVGKPIFIFRGVSAYRVLKVTKYLNRRGFSFHWFSK